MNGLVTHGYMQTRSYDSKRSLSFNPLHTCKEYVTHSQTHTHTTLCVHLKLTTLQYTNVTNSNIEHNIICLSSLQIISEAL